MSPARAVLSRGQARRVALAAQGFLDPRPAPWTATMRHMQRVLDRVGVVQIDSVNVLTRSHYLPFFSRLGPYDTGLLDRARDRAPRRVVEYWAHEASLIPPATWPLLAFRMRRAADSAWGSMRRVVAERPELVAAVEAEVGRRGPLTSREVELALEHDLPRGAGQWGWNWSEVKQALEYLFWAGRISSAGRTSQFERRYAATDVVAPQRHRDAWRRRPGPEHDADAMVELVRIAARSHGVATERCLADYFRLSREDTRCAVARLVADGELVPVTVPGWAPAAYLHAAARVPRRVQAATLLSPFDSLVWQRRRILGLWDFAYRIEIYTPAHRRVHGYYVLPFLYGERLVARCDLKADRAAGVLRCHRVTWEPQAPVGAAPALEATLRSMADWLGLDTVASPGTGSRR
ncbi:MAG TPA: crosslink repair DNA glycosylase YcaQ family protein [Intrasporangium sp.]|uniref:winged helix-turn-helix domain-containing protein n=1 Tax=Intrasporangium sp. TaxID=1925024 RepID=UPI002D76FD0D|nr:crosslink repair DNA glycosylase YcaQ family protein [Intrasporangium sp.]HET7400006.1 crosslink repair DNA glycosylase YcaQ family protein [Intrasporangium sp.]